MSISEKLANAQATEWLSEGLEEKEIREIKELALIAAKIEGKRSSLGMTQKEFARMMGVSQGMVSRWESGTYNFTVTTLNDICDKLGLIFEPIIREEAYYCENDFETMNVYTKSYQKNMQVWKVLEDCTKREEIA